MLSAGIHPIMFIVAINIYLCVTLDRSESLHRVDHAQAASEEGDRSVKSDLQFAIPRVVYVG